MPILSRKSAICKFHEIIMNIEMKWEMNETEVNAGTCHNYVFVGNRIIV